MKLETEGADYLFIYISYEATSRCQQDTESSKRFCDEHSKVKELNIIYTLAHARRMTEQQELF